MRGLSDWPKLRRFTGGSASTQPTVVTVWLIFATLYLLVPSSPFSVFSAAKPSEAIRFVEQAAVYSLGAVARLNPEPRPDGPNLFQFLVIGEGLVGPLQLGLLFLAIRRQVMR
jgi:hypothetical protein